MGNSATDTYERKGVCRAGCFDVVSAAEDDECTAGSTRYRFPFDSTALKGDDAEAILADEPPFVRFMARTFEYGYGRDNFYESFVSDPKTFQFDDSSCCKGNVYQSQHLPTNLVMTSDFMVACYDASPPRNAEKYFLSFAVWLVTSPYTVVYSLCVLARNSQKTVKRDTALGKCRVAFACFLGSLLENACFLCMTPIMAIVGYYLSRNTNNLVIFGTSLLMSFTFSFFKGVILFAIFYQDHKKKFRRKYPGLNALEPDELLSDGKGGNGKNDSVKKKSVDVDAGAATPQKSPPDYKTSVYAGAMSTLGFQEEDLTWTRDSTGRREKLPPNWAVRKDASGAEYYVNHVTKTTTWAHPMLPRIPGLKVEALLKENEKKVEQAQIANQRRNMMNIV
jgi:hypothetical protein